MNYKKCATVTGDVHVFDVRKYGAVGDGATRDTAAIQATIDLCANSGGGIVFVPPGRFLSGAIRLRSYVNLYIAPGATLLASRMREDYEAGRNGASSAYFLLADAADYISVTGGGTIDGQAIEDYGRIWAPMDRDFRTGMILFSKCTNVLLSEITIRNSDSWTVHMRRCDTVTIDQINILNNIRHINSDGIDPVSCRNVHISNCHIESGDDSICPKAEEGYDCEGIVVTNCTLVTTATGIKLGTSSDGNFRDLHFSNITISAPTGIGLYMKDGGIAERVTFSNISIETPSSTYRTVLPIFLDIEKRTPDSPLSRIRDVTFRDIFVQSGSSIVVQGMPERPIENLTIENLIFRADKPDDFSGRRKPKGGRSQSSPTDATFAGMESYMAVGYVSGLNLENVTLVVAEDAFQKYPRTALTAHEVRNIRLVNIQRFPAGSDSNTPVVKLHNAQRAFMTACMAAPGTPVFLELSGSRTADVALIGNDLQAADEPYTLVEGVTIKPREA